MDIKRIINTVRYLKPIQVMSYLHKGGTRFDLSLQPPKTKPYSLFIEELDGKPEIAIHGNQITLLNETADIPFETWCVPEKSHLWNFNLHYFEHCNEEMIERYDLNSKDAKHPYTVSLRLINLLIKKPEVAKKIYPQYRFLIKNQETRLLANHYFENLKTIVICSLIYGEDRVYTKYIKKFLCQCKEQILADGVHFELSPMYQKIILEDLLRVSYVLKQAGQKDLNDVLPYVKRMVDATASIEKGFNRTPLFNDAGDNVAKKADDLLKAAERLFDIKPEYKTDLPNSGYHKLYNDNIAIIYDAGKIGPNYMPGHGHCDCQSFELAVNGEPIIVNSGTYAYQTELRSYFRGTSAHNTVMINEHEQSECWGEHRVARRINDVTDHAYKNYLGEKHERLFDLNGNILTVLDRTSAGTVKSFLHVAPGAEKRIVVNPINCEFTKQNYKYSSEFGILEDAICYVFYWDADENQHGFQIEIK